MIRQDDNPEKTIKQEIDTESGNIASNAVLKIDESVIKDKENVIPEVPAENAAAINSISSTPETESNIAQDHPINFILIGQPIDQKVKEETNPGPEIEAFEAPDPKELIPLMKNPRITADSLSQKLKRQIFGLVAACMLITGGICFGGGYYLSRSQIGTGSTISLFESSREPGNDAALAKIRYIKETGVNQPLTVSEVTALTADSVVEIRTEAAVDNSRSVQYVTTGAGSGVVVTADGYIITNNHVVEGASTIAVSLRNGEVYEATLVGTDSKTDIALLKIEATGLSPAVLGDSGQLVVGEMAVAIGNPLGQLGGTVTDGIISALDRELEFDNATMNLLQTNAAINPGNSGGGLFNTYGELIGIVNAKSTGSGVEGLGFAIPINDIKAVLSDLMTYGYVEGRIDLKMTLQDINGYYGVFYGYVNTGVYVAEVDTGSNAEKNGIKTGDYITSIGSTRVSTVAEVNKLLQNYKVGDEVVFQIVRDKRTYSVTMKLETYTGD